MKPHPPTEKTNIQLIAESLFLLGVIALCASYFVFQGRETPEQKAAKEQQILNEWFESGSDIACENHLKEQLRDPSSYERNGDFTAPSNDGNKRIITWKFRSKNGFGGYNSGIGMCLITKANGGTVKATVLGE